MICHSNENLSRRSFDNDVMHVANQKSWKHGSRSVDDFVTRKTLSIVPAELTFSLTKIKF